MQLHTLSLHVSCRLLSTEELGMHPKSAAQACLSYTNCELALSIKTLLEARSPCSHCPPHSTQRVSSRSPWITQTPCEL